MGEYIANIGLVITYILGVLLVLALIGTEVMVLLKNPKNAKKTLINLGILIGVFLICWVISSDSMLPVYEKMDVTPTSSKLIGGGLIMFYILFFGAIVSALYVEISGLFKR
jgi:uncharacterized membrane protein YeiB